jgi:hypothetical protein
MVTCNSAYKGFATVTSEASTELAQNGFVVWRELKPGASTMDVSAAIGKVVDIEGLLPGRGIPPYSL